MSAAKRKPKPNSSRFLRILHSGFLMIWVSVTTVLFTTFILLVRPLSRGLAFDASRVWTILVLFMSGIRLDVSGREKLERGRSYIVMSNHASAMDIPIVYAALPFRFGFMAKRELFLIPFFGWGVAATGHIPVDRNSPRRAQRSVERAVQVLRSGGNSLAVFPEGTRTRTGELGRFKLGVFSIAVDAGVPIVPVAIRESREILPRGSYLINPSRVTVRIGEPISTAGFTRNSKGVLSEVVRDHIAVLLQDRG